MCSYSWRVPFHACGELKIVPSNNLGALGPTKGEPTLYTWHWYYCVPGMALWIVLVLAMGVPRANRTPGVLLILVPVLGVYVVWLGVARLLPFGASDNEVFAMMVLSLAVGTASLWLVGHRFADGSWLKMLIGALAVAVGVAFVGTLSFGFGLGGETAQFVFLVSILTAAVVLGYALAGWMLRGRYRPFRLIVLLSLGTIAVSVVGMFLLFAVWSALSGEWPSMLVQILIYLLIAGLVMGTCVTLISLSFVLIGLRSRLFRPRLLACLRLQSATENPVPAA